MGFCSTTIDESDSYEGMSKTFRPWDIEQRWLLPPSVHELVPAGHVFRGHDGPMPPIS
jgi:hypothetical protein